MTRKYCEKEMSHLMREFEASDMGSDAFALANSIPKSTFYKWKVRYRASQRHHSNQDKTPAFAAIPVADEQIGALPKATKTEKPKAPSTSAGTGGRLVITMPNGLRLELDL